MKTPALGRIASPSLQVPGTDPWYAESTDPAITVMTDFRERASVTVDETATIDAALDHMKHNGVRCAFAIDATRRIVVGLITAYDILGEKPMRHAVTVEMPRTEVRVRDIMQKLTELRVVDVRDLEQCMVGAVLQLFDDTQLTHIVVIESGAGGEQRLRGLLSAAKVRRLLGR
jgi:CBS domain-containing protein